MTELTQQRKEFEAWAREKMLCDPEHLERLTAGRGAYRLHNVNCWWIGFEAGRSSLESENARLREAASYAIAMIGSVLKSAQCVIGPTDTVMLQESKKQLTLARGAIRGGTNV